MQILTAGRRAEVFLLEGATMRAALSATAPGIAEHAAQQIFETAATAHTATAGATLETIGAEAEAFEIAGARTLTETAAARPRAAEIMPLKARLALGIDLAAVESLALVGIARDLISRIEFGKARSGLGVMLVGVRMQLLGQAPVGAFDFGLARTLRNPQNFVGVAHPCNLREIPLPAGAKPATRHLMWGSKRPDAIRGEVRVYERFQGLSARTSQTPFCCLQASPWSQASDEPRT
jgi:hypothetical protein